MISLRPIEMRFYTYKTRLRGFDPVQPTTVGFVGTEPHFNGADNGS
jgi:hypothetical protein